MNIIQISAGKSGSRPPIQSWSETVPPSGYAEVNCDTAAFYAHNGFVTLTIADGMVTDMVPNISAWEAWKAEEAAKPKPEEIPTLEERNRADIDFVAVMTGVTL